MEASNVDLATVSTCDVSIVGSGIAGMAAAFEVASGGRRALVVEACEEPGGASLMSGGASCIVGSPLQEAAGIKDSVELALQDWARYGGPEANLEWARRYLAASRHEVYDWCEQLGVVWEGPNHHVHNSVPRGHRPLGAGTAVTRAVTQAAFRAGAGLATSARVVRLLQADGRVTGVVVQHHGVEREIRANAVLMTTGGFVNNPEMLRRHSSTLQGVKRFLCGGAPQATGSGHALLESIGAQFAGLGNLWIYPDGTPNPQDPSGQRGVLIRGSKTEIWVNERGERFYNELLTDGMTGTPAQMAQPGQHCWAIFDRKTAENCDLRDDSYYGLPRDPIRSRIDAFFATSTYIRRADTVGELAERVGLPADRVCAEVDAFNGAVASGNGIEARFDRKLKGAWRIAEPPFFAVEYMPTVQKNLGGVKTDLECHVLSTAGQPIPGLYAAGELAGMAGGHINGRAAIENTMFAPCLYSGRVAGRAIAADLSRSAAGGVLAASPARSFLG